MSLWALARSTRDDARHQVLHFLNRAQTLEEDLFSTDPPKGFTMKEEPILGLEAREDLQEPLTQRLPVHATLYRGMTNPT